MFDDKALKKIQDGKKNWEKGPLARSLAKSPEAKPVFTTISGAPVERLYTPLDVENGDYDRDLGYPGTFPFTRGVQPTMYRGRYWTMRQYA
ncbi:MAG: methylmalonyl-CoA mutase family protein, partial [Syntrophobacteraceae bacterium]|nr:methylmalonyl-CoA mutase family protein [Syntrophobacteraceae bacterium]